jgi:hypothetical protein
MTGVVPIPDRVVILDGHSGRNLAMTDFMGLPLQERVRLLLAGRVTFYVGEERLVTREALAALQMAEQTGHGRGSSLP